MDWIKVEDHLPVSGDSISYVWDGKEILKDVYFDPSTKRWETEHKMGWLIGVKSPITHWMLHPQPPKD